MAVFAWLFKKWAIIVSLTYVLTNKLAQSYNQKPTLDEKYDILVIGFKRLKTTQSSFQQKFLQPRKPVKTSFNQHKIF